MPVINTGSNVFYCIEDNTSMALLAFATELIPIANGLLIGKYRALLQETAKELATGAGVLPNVSNLILAVPFDLAKKGGILSVSVGKMGKASIAIGFTSATNLGGMQILGNTDSHWERGAWSNWRFNTYPLGRRLWQEEFGLAGTSIPESTLLAEIAKATGKLNVWANAGAPMYSGFRGHKMGFHYIYGKDNNMLGPYYSREGKGPDMSVMVRDEKGRVRGLKPGPGRAPKRFLRRAVAIIGEQFAAEFAAIIAEKYGKLDADAMAKVKMDETKKMHLLNQWSTRSKTLAGGRSVIGGGTKNLHAHHGLAKSVFPELALCIDNAVVLEKFQHKAGKEQLGFVKEVHALTKKKGLSLTQRRSQMLSVVSKYKNDIPNVYNLAKRVGYL